MITPIRPALVRTTGCPELAESADLIRSALGTRQRPGTSRPPRTVLHAVRLMYASWVVELSAVVTIVGTTGSVKSVVLGRNPGFTAEQWRATATLASHARAPGGRHPPGSPPEALAGDVVMAPARLPRRGWRSTRNQTSGASC